MKAFLVFANQKLQEWFRANLYSFIISHQDVVRRFVLVGAHYASTRNPEKPQFSSLLEHPSSFSPTTFLLFVFIREELISVFLP